MMIGRTTAEHAAVGRRREGSAAKGAARKLLVGRMKPAARRLPGGRTALAARRLPGGRTVLAARRLFTAWMALVLGLAALAGALAPAGERSARAAGLSLADVARDAAWALAPIAELVQKQVFTGYPDGTFGPNREVSRIETLAAVVRQMGLRETAESERAMRGRLQAADAGLIREQYAWAAGYVYVAEGQKLLDDARGELRPGAPADREWTARVLVRALGLAKQAEAAAGSALSFRDAAAVGEASVGYVAVASEIGLIGGYPDGTFRPARTVTRAELAALLDRAEEHMPEANAAYPEIDAVVEGVSGGFVTLRQGTASQMFPLTKTATIVRGGKLAAAGELQPGDRVRAVFFNYEIVHLNVTSAAAAPEGERKGTIVSLQGIGNGVISLRTSGGVVQLKLDPSAVITRNGEPAATGDLQEGDDAVALLEAGAIVELRATEVNRFTGQIRGLLEAVDGKTMTIVQSDDTKMTLPLQEHATFLLNQSSVSWSELRPGQSVTAVAAEGYIFHVTAAADVDAVFDENVTGMVSAVYPRQIMLSRGAGEPDVYNLSSDVVVTKLGRDISISDVRPGDEVMLVMRQQQVLVLIVTKPAPQVTDSMLEDVIYYNHAGRGQSITELTVIRMIDGNPVYFSFPVSENVIFIGGEIWQLVYKSTKLDLILNDDVVTAILFKENPTFPAEW